MMTVSVAAESDRERLYLQLLNAIDLKMDQQLRLTDRLTYTPAPTPSVEESLAAAQKSRPQFAVLQKARPHVVLRKHTARSTH